MAIPGRRATGGRRGSTTITLSGGPLGNSPTIPSRGSLNKQASIIPSNLTAPSAIVGQESSGKTKRGVVGGTFQPVTLAGMSPQVKQSWSTIEQFKMQQEIKNNNAKPGNKRKQSTMEDYAQTASKMKLTEDFSEVYFFSSPLAYFRAVEVSILLNSLYLSIWAVNFIAVAEGEAENPVMWQLLMLVPLVVCVPLVGEIVKTASLLSAIAELEVDVIGSVLENMEDEKALLLELRDKIARRLEHCNMQAEKKEIVNALFYEIDADRSGFISRYEFRDMLRALHLHYSDHKFKKLFNVIDKDRSGSISEQELTDVVFPEEAHEDDFKNRTKIVNEHMEVHKEKKKLEQSRNIQKPQAGKRNWGIIKNISKSLTQFKSGAVAAPLLPSNVMAPNGDVPVLGEGGYSSSSSSSSDSESSSSTNTPIKVKPFADLADGQEYLSVIHSLDGDGDGDDEEEKEESQSQFQSEHVSGSSRRRSDSDRRSDGGFSVRIGRSADNIDEMLEEHEHEEDGVVEVMEEDGAGWGSRGTSFHVTSSSASSSELAGAGGNTGGEQQEEDNFVSSMQDFES